MSRGEQASGWIAAIASLLTAIPIIVGVFKWYYQQKWQSAADEVGSIALDENKMGYFTVNWVSHQSCMFKFFHSTCRRLGWIFSFIGKWICGCRERTITTPELPTISAILRGGHWHIYTSSMFDWLPHGHGDVTWKDYYEAFFNELAFHELAILGSRSKYSNQWIKIAVNEARKKVEIITRTRMEKVDPKDLDRHLLYPGYLNSVRPPVLVDCTRPLPQHPNFSIGGNFDPISEYSNKTTRYNLHTLWIYNNRPCLEVSSAELAALSFALGMPLHFKKDGRGNESLSGSGVYGTYIRGVGGETIDPWRLQLLHWRRDHPNQDPSKGSSYSILFATCMGCGCIPFARSLGLTHVVRVNSDIYKVIKEGNDIVDMKFSGKDSARDYLYRLPSATRMYYYENIGAKNPCLTHITDSSGNTSHSWSEIVAGIAFGGLVPMASLYVVQAVRHTAGGGISTKDIGLSELRELLMKIQRSANDFQLFGQYIEENSLMETDPAVIRREVNPAQFDIRTAAAVFARYMTMLEYITAHVSEKPTNPVDAVFDACSNELNLSYQNASVSSSDLITPREDLQNILAQKMPFDVVTCGKIARYIILAWTYYVGIVVWSDGEKKAAEEFLEGTIEEDKIYFPRSLQRLPPVSVLE